VCFPCVRAAATTPVQQMGVAELGARCFVARSHHRNARTVVGIATERANDGLKGCSLDLFMIDKPEWNEEIEKRAACTREEFGFFKSP